MSRLLRLVLALLLISPLAEAVTTVQISVTVVAPPPCTLNGGQPISVFFGDTVQTTQVDGANYKQSINYNLRCTGNASNALKLTISGTAANFDSAVLKTEQSDLGIALFNGSSRLALNEEVHFTYADNPELKAAPIKKAGSILKGGPFSAAATIKVDYQ